jgi:hypothetical protein
MGEPVTVTEKPSSRSGFVRFETNRTFTGMGHERYAAGEEIYGNRSSDEVARALFATGKVDEVHVYGQAVTVKLFKDETSEGLREVLENLYIHYRPGVEVPTAESFATES